MTRLDRCRTSSPTWKLAFIENAPLENTPPRASLLQAGEWRLKCFWGVVWWQHCSLKVMAAMPFENPKSQKRDKNSRTDKKSKRQKITKKKKRRKVKKTKRWKTTKRQKDKMKRREKCMPRLECDIHKCWHKWTHLLCFAIKKHKFPGGTVVGCRWGGTQIHQAAELCIAKKYGAAQNLQLLENVKR